MDLYKVAQEIRDILSKRQKEFQLTFEEDTHKYTMLDLDGKLHSNFPSVSKVMKLFYDEFPSEKKAFEIAKEYNKTGPYSRDYQAAISAFDNFIIDFPGTTLKEDAMFYRLDSAFKMAVNSVEWKKEQRLKDAKSYYDTFVRLYSESKFNEEIKSMGKELVTQLQPYNSKS